MWKKGNLEVTKGKGHFGESNGLWEEEETINVLKGRCGGKYKYGGSGSCDSYTQGKA